MRTAVARLLLLCAFALLAGGCASYRLGTGAKLAFDSIYIPPADNPAAVPQATALVTREIRSAFMRDGRVSLANSAADADVILEITLGSYDRQMTAVQPQDTALARKFDITLTALCTLRNAHTGEVLFENRPVESTRQVFTDGGQLPAEYQTLPNIAQLLADRVLHAVLDVW